MENWFKESLTQLFQNHFSCPQSVRSHFSSVVKSWGNTRRRLLFNLLESREVSKIPLQEVVSKGGNVTQVFSQVMTPSLLYYMFFLYFLYVKGNVTSRKWRHPAQARLRLWPRPSILPQTSLQCLHLQSWWIRQGCYSDSFLWRIEWTTGKWRSATVGSWPVLWYL